MGFQAILQQFLSEGSAHQASTYRSLVIFLPELVLSCSIVLMLLARLIDLDKIIPTHWIALIGAIGAFAITLFQFWKMTNLRTPKGHRRFRSSRASRCMINSRSSFAGF